MGFGAGEGRTGRQRGRECQSRYGGCHWEEGLPPGEKIMGVQNPRRWAGSRAGTENKESEYPHGEKGERMGGGDQSTEEASPLLCPSKR